MDGSKEGRGTVFFPLTLYVGQVCNSKFPCHVCSERFDLIEEQEAGERRFSNRVNKIRKALKDLVKGGDRDELERTGQEAIVVLGRNTIPT